VAADSSRSPACRDTVVEILAFDFESSRRHHGGSHLSCNHQLAHLQARYAPVPHINTHSPSQSIFNSTTSSPSTRSSITSPPSSPPPSTTSASPQQSLHPQPDDVISLLHNDLAALTQASNAYLLGKSLPSISWAITYSYCLVITFSTSNIRALGIGGDWTILAWTFGSVGTWTWAHETGLAKLLAAWEDLQFGLFGFGFGSGFGPALGLVWLAH